MHNLVTKSLFTEGSDGAAEEEQTEEEEGDELRREVQELGGEEEGESVVSGESVPEVGGERVVSEERQEVEDPVSDDDPGPST